VQIVYAFLVIAGEKEMLARKIGRKSDAIAVNATKNSIGLRDIKEGRRDVSGEA